MQLKPKCKRILALLLSLLMLVSALPTSTFAEADTNSASEEVLPRPIVTEIVIYETEDPGDLETEESIPAPETANEELLADSEEETVFLDIGQQEDDSEPETEDNAPPDEFPSPADDGNPLQRAIDVIGYAYVMTAAAAKGYSTAEMDDQDHVFTITRPGAVLLATKYVKRENADSVQVWFISEDNETFSAYIAAKLLADTILHDEEVNILAGTLCSARISSEAGKLYAFVVEGEKMHPAGKEPSVDQPQEPVVDETVAHAENNEDAATQEHIAGEHEPSQEMENQPQEEIIEWAAPSDDPKVTEAPVLDLPAAQVGDFVAVTKQTRAFVSIDETATDDYEGDLSLGVFVNDAAVQIEAIEQDHLGRRWYRVRYMYGDDYADGTLKWTDYSTIYVLASETNDTAEHDFRVTDYAFPTVPSAIGRLVSTPMNGFSLKSINGSIGTFTVGQNSVQGSSGRDGDYKQIASLPGHGTIYATPHYLDGVTVYCLEHNLPGPGERISGGGQQPTGPYLIVDIDSYMNTPSNSKVIYHESTLHAIAWVLRHTYPFMVLDRSDSDNETWSRVAGQFAIREVIKQMEGAQYVRDYWDMDNFYTASGQAPAVYLTYARWLAANGIARGRITGDIAISNKSVVPANGTYTGTVTLSTDADLIRISKSAGIVTGHTAGSDSAYYYLNSGDTISVSSTANGFSMVAESISSDTEEANFLVGVPSAQIQKVLIPQYGVPYEMKSASIYFEEVILYGDLTVIKCRDRGDQRALANAQFQLYDNNGAAVGSPVTTDANGKATWTHLRYGRYFIAEVYAPAGYQVDTYWHSVEINESVIQHTFTDAPVFGSIRVVKKANGKDIPLVGAKYELLTQLGNDYERAVSVVDGSQLPVLTTDINGIVTWSNVVEYGEYYVHEVEAPEGYQLDNSYYRTNLTVQAAIEITNVKDALITGQIRIIKKDQLTKSPLTGAVFTVTRLSAPASHNGASVGEIVAVITTDANGIAATGWLEWGKYRIEETTVPAHYVDNHFSADIEMYENGKTYIIEVENEPTKGYIQIVKTDRLDRTPIKGVQFDIYYNDQYGEGLAASMVTNKDGVAISSPLPKGKYVVREHGSPTGYEAEMVELNALVKSDETTHLSASNQPIQGKIKIVKRDQLTKEALAGAEFTITRISGLPSHKGSNDGEVVAVITTDANGFAVSPLLTWGRYRVSESKVPEHYVDNSFSAEVIINEDNLKTYEIEVENEPTKGWIKLTKSDRQSGNPIEGVRFDIHYNDEYGSGLAGTMVTGKDGIAVSEPLRKGKYIVKEHGGTAGYLFEEITVDATVKSDQTTELEVTNRHVTVKLKLYKRDTDEFTGDNPNASATVKPNNIIPEPADISAPATRGDGVLTGAEFQVLAGEDIKDRQGNVAYTKGTVVVESLRTVGDDASVTTGELWPGLYVITELTPPVGYQASDEPIFVDARSAAGQSKLAIITYEGLKTNEIKYGAKAIVKILGSDEKESDPGRVETPEMNAEFDVYLKSAGSYEDAREFERDHLITDENGYAMTKALPYGIYVLKQTVGKDGYEIKGPIDFEIDGTENLVNPPPITLSDKPILYRLRFIKVDEETGGIITLANTSFKLKNADGHYVTQKLYYPKEVVLDTFTTDDTGSVTLPETVTWGLYFIEEVQSPEGYLIRTEDLAVFIGRSGDMPGEVYELNILIPNQPVKGNIVLEKKGVQLTGFKSMTDAHGNIYQQPIYEEKYLEGAVFDVYAAEDIIGRDGTVWYQQDEYVDAITTTASGSDHSKTLPLGRYFLIETKAPEGFVFEDTQYEANLVFADNKTAKVEVKLVVGNEYLPVEISLKKEKEVTQVIQNTDGTVGQIITNTPGEGFVFGLFNDKDIHYRNGTLMADTLMATGTTDANGNLTISGYYPHGLYYIKELHAPAGWKLNPEHFEISLDPTMKVEDDNIIRVSLPEAVHDELIYTPITLTKTDITGENTLPGALIEVRNDGGKVIYRAYTDEDGHIPDIPVTPGRYTFREILAPEGFSLNEAVMTFTVDEDGSVTGDDTIRDDYTRFSILKHDENGQPMPGVQFSLMKENGSKQFIAVSDENGLVTFEKIPYGSYTIQETKPLPGYLKNDTGIEITVDGTFINPAEPLATLVNIPNEVLIKKVDQDGFPLAGAVFGLFDADGVQLMTAVSDENGIVKFSKIPYGQYMIRETVVPDNYLLNPEPIELALFETYSNNPEPLATIVNRLKRIRYIKVDTAGKHLPDVEFSLIHAATGDIVEVVTSNDKGEFVFTQFDYGDWIIRETKVPEGFNKMQDVFLHVDETWTEPAPVTCVNIPNHYEFVKTDHKGNPLAGVKFTLEDGDGNIIRDLVSGEDGIVHVTDLAPGTYIIREIETLEGFTRTEETIKVIIDEHYTVPTKMLRLINYPNIQTGVEFTMTPVMWGGVALVLAAVILIGMYGVKGKKKKARR